MGAESVGGRAGQVIRELVLLLADALSHSQLLLTLLHIPLLLRLFLCFGSFSGALSIFILAACLRFYCCCC